MSLKIPTNILLPDGIFRQHYWIKRDHVVEQIHFNNRTFFSKYERIDAPLTNDLFMDHLLHKITIAHALIFPYKHIANIVIDYNGNDAKRFYHHLQHQLNALKIEIFTPFQSKTTNHIHVYLHYAPMPLQEGIQLGKIISKKLSDKLPGQWRIYPNDNLPEAYNILNLPYDQL